MHQIGVVLDLALAVVFPQQSEADPHQQSAANRLQTPHLKQRRCERRQHYPKPDRGAVKMAYTTLNQHGEPVMTLVAIQLVKARPV